MVRHAAEALRTALRDGHCRTGDVIESEHRLSEKLGVSRGTVRVAIDLLVATGELTRRPHSRPVVGIAHERPARGAACDVYVWVSKPFFDDASLMFVKGVSLGLKGMPYRMVVREPTGIFGNRLHSEERQFLSDLIENPDAAAVIVQRDPFASNEDVVEALLRAGKRLVFVDSPPPKGIACDYVGSANLAAAREGVEHLIELGHRRIACLVETNGPVVTQERIKGYWRAMRQAGLADDGVCLVASELRAVEARYRPAGRYAGPCAPHGTGYLDWAQRLVVELLAMPRRPTALFVGCDVLAYAVGSLLEGAGLRIPEDFSIVGFDWLGRWEAASADDLTTAGQDFEGLGRHAADLLLDRLLGEAPPTPRHVFIPAPLVVRSSTAAWTADRPRSSRATLPSQNHESQNP